MHLNLQSTRTTTLNIDAMNKKGGLFLLHVVHTVLVKMYYEVKYIINNVYNGIVNFNFICVFISRIARNKSVEPLGVPNTPDSSVIIFCCLDEEISLLFLLKQL